MPCLCDPNLCCKTVENICHVYVILIFAVKQWRTDTYVYVILIFAVKP